MESPTSLLAAAALRSSPPPRVPRPRRPRRRLTVAGLIAVIVAVAAPAADADTRVVFSTSEPLAPTDTDTTADAYLVCPAAR
jgi:hypothetical protein